MVLPQYRPIKGDPDVVRCVMDRIFKGCVCEGVRERMCKTKNKSKKKRM